MQEFSWLLVSDVDGTLLGDDEAVDAFADWRNENPQARVVYNSGRFIQSVQESVRDTNLPQPDAIVGGVGTEIFSYVDSRLLHEWPESFENFDSKSVIGRLEANPNLELQPEEFQSPWKVSYYAYDLSASQLESLQAELDESGLRAQIVYSSNRDLDILPSAANKGAATAFLANFWGVSQSRVVVSGDSGNDSTMFERGFRGVVVANAHPELLALESSKVYVSPQSYARGVIDGLEHWMADATPDRPSTPGLGADRGTP